jgi:mRNA-degrading endonuclease RelE of RelBE toxin-antitoxin system
LFGVKSMTYEVKTTRQFEKQLERLAKKYASITRDVKELGLSLSQNPFQGNGLGKDMYKVRMKIASKGKGKSGGARIITLVLVTDLEVRLLAIYDKSELGNMTDAELRKLLNK